MLQVSQDVRSNNIGGELCGFQYSSSSHASVSREQSREVLDCALIAGAEFRSNSNNLRAGRRAGCESGIEKFLITKAWVPTMLGINPLGFYHGGAR